MAGHTVQTSDGAAVDHDPEHEHLDFVQSMKLAGPIERRPGLPLARGQAGDLDDGSGEGYKTWGFRVLLSIELRAELLGS